MSIVFFGVGFILFSIYLVFLVWNIIHNGNKQQEENYPTLKTRHDNVIDMDGIGNQGRIPTHTTIRTKKRKTKSYGNKERTKGWKSN